jgi:hypothetical protein
VGGVSGAPVAGLRASGDLAPAGAARRNAADWMQVLDRLSRDGVFGPITAARVAAGPLLVRVAASAAGEHVLLDLTDDPGHPLPAMRSTWTDHLQRVASGGVAPHRRVVVAVADPVAADGPRAWYHRTPWPAAMLAEAATATVPAPLPGPQVFAALGALLARVHASALPVTPRPVPPLVRTVAAAAQLTGPQRDLLARIAADAHDDESRPVHGQPALGHVLVPTGPVPPGAPAAEVIDWTAGLAGSAGLDLGYLLGDLTEIAVLVGLRDPARGDRLRARVGDVRDGYCRAAPSLRTPQAEGGSPAGGAPFWDRVHDGAILRLLDHRSTLVRLVGSEAAPTRLTDRVLAHLTSDAFRQRGFRP